MALPRIVLQRALLYQGSHARLEIMKMRSFCTTPGGIVMPETFKGIIFPPANERTLPIMPKVPVFAAGETPKKAPKLQIEYRGPELVHTDLIYKQYAIIADDGGIMKHEHFESVRKHVNGYLTPEMFAVWRIDPPWLPRTPRSKGKKRGGGKGKIAFYVTPVRHGRVILELGGFISRMNATRILITTANNFPFKTRYVSYEELLLEREKEKQDKRENLNRYTWEYLMKWNMNDCTRILSPYDYVWGGKHR